MLAFFVADCGSLAADGECVSATLDHDWVGPDGAVRIPDPGVLGGVLFVLSFYVVPWACESEFCGGVWCRGACVRGDYPFASPCLFCPITSLTATVRIAFAGYCALGDVQSLVPQKAWRGAFEYGGAGVRRHSAARCAPGCRGTVRSSPVDFWVCWIFGYANCAHRVAGCFGWADCAAAFSGLIFLVAAFGAVVW